MKCKKYIICLICCVLYGAIHNCCQSQTLEQLEVNLIRKKIQSKPTFWKSYWKSSWNYWEKEDVLSCGVDYNYSKAFPASFSFHVHKQIFFLGISFGFATDKKTFSYYSSTPDSTLRSTSITNGDTTHYYYYFDRDSSYSLSPSGFITLEPGINLNIITLSCGIGFWGGDIGKKIEHGSTYGSTSTSGDVGTIINPNIMIHLPIPGSDNLLYLNMKIGYNYLHTFNQDVVLKRLAAQGNGWKYGAGLEFRFEF